MTEDRLLYYLICILTYLHHFEKLVRDACCNCTSRYLQLNLGNEMSYFFGKMSYFLIRMSYYSYFFTQVTGCAPCIWLSVRKGLWP